jgi:putative two-component system response regulator
VLVVDDDRGVRKLIGRWLDAAGFSPRAAAGAEEALALMAEDPSAVALCDIAMPGHDGLWLAEELRRRFPTTALIMVTGQRDLECVISSLKAGVLDYLVKPFEVEHLLRAVERGIQWNKDAVAAEQRLARLEQEADSRREQLAEALSLAEINSKATVKALLAMLTLHDRSAYEHGLRVAALAVALADELGVVEPARGHLEVGALLHDVGKIAVPGDMLSKPARLTEAEQDVMHTHADWGGQIMRKVPFLAASATVVESSHERFDGSGYPLGLIGQAIPLGARIIAVADSYDAMVSRRAYRDSASHADAFAEVLACRGVLFDPDVVDALARAVSALNAALPLSSAAAAPLDASGGSAGRPTAPSGYLLEWLTSDEATAAPSIPGLSTLHH